MIKMVGRRLADLHKDFITKAESSAPPTTVDGILRAMNRQWLAPLTMSQYNMDDGDVYMNNRHELSSHHHHQQQQDQDSEEDGQQQQMIHMLPPPPPPPKMVSRRPSQQAHHGGGGGGSDGSRSGNKRAPLPRPNRRGGVNPTFYPDRDEEEEEEETEEEEGNEEEEDAGELMDDKDAGDLLVNFFASVHKNYGSDEETHPADGEGEADIQVARATKRVKVDTERL